MTSRRLPGAVALGLLASLIAHTALYGGEHTMGGAYHALLLQAAGAACVAFLSAFAAVAWAGARRISDGSILAARLTERCPSFPMLFASATGWYVIAEALEPRHAATSPLAAVVFLALAAWLLLSGARAVARLVARVALAAVTRTSFAPRAPFWVRRPCVTVIARRSPLLRRRFARPPPPANACA